MPIVGWIAAWLLKKTIIKPRTANAIAWAITIVGAALLAFGAWQLVKANIIHGYKTEQRAKTAEQTVTQIQEADAADKDLEARDDAAADQLQEEANHAAQADPTGAAKPVGPVTRAVTDELRDQRRRQAGGD